MLYLFQRYTRKKILLYPVYRSKIVLKSEQEKIPKGIFSIRWQDVNGDFFGIIINMTTINPWINFNGNAEEAFTFYKSVFGGDFVKIIRFKDIASSEFPVPDEESDKIMFIALPIGGNGKLLGNDVPAFMGKVNEKENRSKILINTDSREEAERLFQGLSVGGEVEGPIGDSPWGSYAGMFRDKYGIEWIIEFSV